MEDTQQVIPQGEYHNLPVDGYKPTQSDEKINAVNALKYAERQYAEAWKIVNGMDGVDKCWMAVAKTHIQEGTMAASRAVFQPADVFVD